MTKFVHESHSLQFDLYEYNLEKSDQEVRRVKTVVVRENLHQFDSISSLHVSYTQNGHYVYYFKSEASEGFDTLRLMRLDLMKPEEDDEEMNSFVIQKESTTITALSVIFVRPLIDVIQLQHQHDHESFIENTKCAIFYANYE